MRSFDRTPRIAHLWLIVAALGGVVACGPPSAEPASSLIQAQTTEDADTGQPVTPLLFELAANSDWERLAKRSA
ncbi:MAG TPA: hypothetical protein VJN18_11440 [Polyangiaceae bacterium]|nr:hypothetical protein [Polyangiaceae bacterium]